MGATENLSKINDEFYSRQLYVLGHEAMKKMATATVLVSGMTGLGVEIAKNVVLAGVKSVTLHDQDDAQWSDLSSQFYLSENNVGQNRAEVSHKHLSKLNNEVGVIPYTSELTEDFLGTFKVVVLTNSSLKEQLRISDFCHANQICFVLADTKGLAGRVFCDFGEKHVVYDPSEADPASAAIEQITLGNPGLLTVAHDGEQEGHWFMDGDWVRFSEIEGMTQLNGSEPRQICVKGKDTLEIGDTSSFSPYQRGGIITEVKMPQKYSYKSLRDCMANPKINTQDRQKMLRYRTLHAAFRALHTFQDEFGRLPCPQNRADADSLVKLVVRTQTLGQEQEDLIRTFAYGCMGDLSPVNSLIGGLAAQEVLKAASGKFTPLDQWLYFDAYECLPEGEQLTEKDCAPFGSRYDGQIAVFGADFQKRLGEQKYFLVGAGAIGCELLKNFAMIGLAAGEGGEITVTDMDIIERSNLNRQFLFREEDVSKQKSEVAAAAIRCMNPNINVVAQQNQVGPDTEHFYGDDFFLALDGVASALDSFQDRNYVGERCVHYLKPLLDSGTDGTKGNFMVTVPYLTKTYEPSQDGDKEFPLCTLRYFPSTIQHTIQWARNQFEDLFKRRAEVTNTFLRDPTFFEKEDMETLEMLNLVKMNLQEQPHCWRDCVVWARKLWERLFRHEILQLLYNYPPGHKTSSGHPFWSASKRCPQPLQFDYNNTTHKDFIVIASRLFAETHRLRVHEDEATTTQALLELHLPPFRPRQGVQIPVTDEEIPTLPSASNQTTLVELKQELGHLREELRGLLSDSMESLQYEKDKDSHSEFITHAANLRAENYGISPVDKFQAKKIAGRIVPAIATTTAAVAGLTCLELYKLVWQHKDLSSYRHGFLQLSEPFLCCSQPLPSPQAYKREHDLVPQRLLFGTATLYNKEDEIEEQQPPFSLTELIREITGKSVPKECRLLELSMVCENEERNDDLPPVHIMLQPTSSPK
ncbi:ubiquitin-like modifier-activating enzyme 7 isoform X2 [Erythrolamprus reginae]|uniref:ubiquitin-like modifier-activating enzyme 7 isoform X2 n=1 Tax=Erythrolamprus reginae TaxID=121349 RepID=UPI00396C9E96